MITLHAYYSPLQFSTVLIPRPAKKTPEEPNFLRPLSAAEYKAQQEEEQAAAAAAEAKIQKAKDDLQAIIQQSKAAMQGLGAEPEKDSEAKQAADRQRAIELLFREPVRGYGKVIKFNSTILAKYTHATFLKIFIEYSTVEEAVRAQKELAGRRFDGRMLITSFLPESRWIEKAL